MIQRERERDMQMHMYSAIHTQESRKRDCNNKKFLPTRKIWEGIILTRQLLVG